MTQFQVVATVSIFLLVAAEPSVAAETPESFSVGPGISLRYARDLGIEGDPAVLFADGFENGDFSKWDENQAQGDPTRTFVTDGADLAFLGNHACQMTATRGRNNGGSLIKWFGEGHDELFARFYVRFADDAGYTHHFVHFNGSPDRWGSFGKAGLRPNGSDFFTTGIEPWFDWGQNAPPGKWMFYSYWPDMKGSRGGKYWGNGFHPKGDVIPRGIWICMEIRVKMNTPGKEDGQQTVWQDGQMVGHFTGIRWRDVDGLKTNVFWLMSYVTEKAFRYTEQHATRHKMRVNTKSHTVWFDQIVVATQYIGPVQVTPPN